MKYLVTLVHGTFASGAEWTQEKNSSLCKALKERFTDKISFDRIDWSGNNTSDARLRGAQILIKQLKSHDHEREDLLHFVVGHSHGGNVMMYAGKDPYVKDNVTGFATLATPFIVAQNRILGPNGLIHLLLGLMLFCFFATIFIRYQFFPDMSARFFIMPGIVFGMICLWLWKQWGVWTTRLLERLELGVPNKQDQLLIVRMSGDEASAGMSAAQLIATVSTRIFFWLSNLPDRAKRMHDRIIQKTKWAVPFLFGFVILGAALDFAARQLEVISPDIAVFPSLLGIVSLFLLIFGWKPFYIDILRVLAAAVIWPVVAVLMLVLTPVFGPSIAGANILLDVTAETTPLGAWTVHLFGIGSDDKGSNSGTEMQHSLIYDDEDVHKLIGDWIEESADNAQRTSASEVDIDINGVYLETT